MDPLICKSEELQEVQVVEVALEAPLVEIVQVLHKAQSEGLGDATVPVLHKIQTQTLEGLRIEEVTTTTLPEVTHVHVEMENHLAAHCVGQLCERPVEIDPTGTATSNILFAEVASLLDPNMKSTKALKYQILYDEVKRRLEPPEKMSLRSLAAYTRVSRGPASRKSLQASLHSLGLSPSTTTAVSSSYSKLTEGDTTALCKDMKEFALQYVDYENVANQLLPDVNQVQHWSKIIETRNHLEEIRKCLHDPVNSKAFNNVTHGFGLGVMDVAFDMINCVIDQQIRKLSGEAEPKEALRETRVRKRKARTKGDGMAKTVKLKKDESSAQKKTRGRRANRKEVKVAPIFPEPQPQVESQVLTLVSVGYETISSGLEPTNAGVV